MAVFKLRRSGVSQNNAIRVINLGAGRTDDVTASGSDTVGSVLIGLGYTDAMLESSDVLLNGELLDANGDTHPVSAGHTITLTARAPKSA